MRMREEDFDSRAQLHRTLHNGMFGENLTTSGVGVTYARIGERWRIGSDSWCWRSRRPDPIAGPSPGFALLDQDLHPNHRQGAYG